MTETKTKPATSWFLPTNDGRIANILLLGKHADLSVVVCGYAMQAITHHVPVFLVGNHQTLGPVIDFAKASGYTIEYCSAGMPASSMFQEGDGDQPTAWVLTVGPGGFAPEDAADILNEVMAFLKDNRDARNLAIVLEDLPVFGAIQDFEAVMERSRNGHLQILISAQNTSEISVTYPATSIKIYENCCRKFHYEEISR